MIVEQPKPIKEILPIEGIWDLKSFANHINMMPEIVQQKLSEKGIKTLILGKHYDNRLINMTDIVKWFEKNKGEDR